MKNLINRQFFSELIDATGGGGGAPPVAPGVPQTPQTTGLPTLPDKWFDNLPAEYKGEESLKNITDFGSLIKSYVHAQKMVGAEKIPIPGKFSTDDDWKNVFSKLGLPKDAAGYNFDMPKDSKFDDDFVKSFKENAHKNGILPKQAAGLMNWFDETIRATGQKNSEKMKHDSETAINGLKTEWGLAYNDNLQIARLAVNKLGDDNLKQFMEESKLGDDPRVIKLFANIGKFLKEEKQVDLGSPGHFTGALTPSDAQKKIDTLLGDPAGPYYNADHPNHKAAIEEAQTLFKSAYPS